MDIKKRGLGIYIHIPFCEKKCAYCDFISKPAADSAIDDYIDVLCKEIVYMEELGQHFNIETVFFGGGTPSILKVKQLDRIHQCLRDHYGVDEATEWTIECNPGTLTEEKLKYYKNQGVTRLSLGLQSANEKELKLLGRIHTYEQFLQNYELARKIGFKNINIDIMSAIPGQRWMDWANTLKQVVQLRPDHISAYSLILEEGTEFEKYNREPFSKLMPNEDEERDMYWNTKEKLCKYGYQHYEISNYAFEGKECMHNLRYWRRKDYIGFGVGAASLIHNNRITNTNKLKDYMQAKDHIERMKKEREVLSKKDKMEEFMFLGLRLIDGVYMSEFRRKFKVNFRDIYGEVTDKLLRDQLIIQDGDNLRLTNYGIDVSNPVLASFLLD